MTKVTAPSFPLCSWRGRVPAVCLCPFSSQWLVWWMPPDFSPTVCCVSPPCVQRVERSWRGAGVSSLPRGCHHPIGRNPKLLEGEELGPASLAYLSIWHCFSSLPWTCLQSEAKAGPCAELSSTPASRLWSSLWCRAPLSSVYHCCHLHFPHPVMEPLAGMMETCVDSQLVLQD